MYGFSLKCVSKEVVVKAEKVGFGAKNSSVKKIREEASNPDHEKPVIRSNKFVRYKNYHSYRDERCRSYNANELATNIWTGEGPVNNKQYNNLTRFCGSILRNKKINFTTVVTIGPHRSPMQTKTNFMDYLDPKKPKTVGDDPYQLTSKPIDSSNSNFHLYTLTAARKRKDNPKELHLVHLPQMQDMQTLECSDEKLIQQLIFLVNRSLNEPIFIHCSAGLGRAGTIAMALVLFQKYNELAELANDEKLINAIYTIWDDFNKRRPGTIQTPAQLRNALEIADAMYTLKLKLVNGYTPLDSPLSKNESTQSSTEASGEYCYILEVPKKKSSVGKNPHVLFSHSASASSSFSDDEASISSSSKLSKS